MKPKKGFRNLNKDFRNQRFDFRNQKKDGQKPKNYNSKFLITLVYTLF